MVIKLFKGQVKIADVQAAFDEIVNKVNTMITNYNNLSYVQDIDYSVGGYTLAPYGYTLTVGGMKQFMESCDGSVIGAKPFKVSSNKLKMTTGLLVTKNGIYRLPDSVLAIPTEKQYRTIYYNTSTGEYVANLNSSDEDLIANKVVYRICDINPNAETKLISNIKGVQNEKVNGTFKITSESRYVKPVCGGNYASGGFRGETPDTSSAPLFIWGQEAVAREGEKTAMTYLFGKLVQWNKQSGHRNLDWWSPLNMLFVPKGVANPYTYSDTFSNFTHWFKVNISKNIKDT